MDAKDHPPLFRVVASLAMLILLFGGGWAALTPAGEAAVGEGTGLAGSRGTGLAGGGTGLKMFAANFPDSRMVLGMLALDRDIEDFREYADHSTPAGKYYREEVAISLRMRPLRGRYEAAFTASHAAAARTAAPLTALFRAGMRKRPYLAAPEEVWLPPKGELPLSHPYALDVFFQSVDRRGEAERGPLIRSLHPGIVIAASSDWSGGQGFAKYRSGGLSPASGNGAVIYDPASRLYFSYFHLSSVAVRVGEIMAAGDLVGRGGNTGMNARMEGHGEHVHIEIFNAARDAPLSSQEILEMLKH